MNSLSIIENESELKVQIEKRIRSLTAQISDKKAQIQLKNENIKHLGTDPSRLQQQSDQRHQALLALEQEIKALRKSNDALDQDKAVLATRRLEGDLAYSSSTLKLAALKETISLREHEILNAQASIDEVKSQHHDLLTRKAEVNLLKKDTEYELRHQSSQYHMSRREAEDSERRLKKKTTILNQAHQVVPALEETLRNTKIDLAQREAELQQLVKSVDSLRDDVDVDLIDFLKKEKVEVAKKTVRTLSRSTPLYHLTHAIHYLCRILTPSAKTLTAWRRMC